MPEQTTGEAALGVIPDTDTHWDLAGLGNANATIRMETRMLKGFADLDKWFINRILPQQHSLNKTDFNFILC